MQNYFELFNLPAAYDLDLTELSTRYRKLQATVHPDKFANATDLERRLSMQQSALINEAYQTLKNPLLRARYMLQLKGVDLSSESSVNMDSEFLMQQMRLREELERVRAQNNPEAKLLVIAKEIEQAIAEQITVLTSLFDESNEKKIPQIADYVRRMQFMVKLQHETEMLEEELMS
ncbi:MAG TPA: Fe-S protein assembly co-chaperone HscB [Gammaproteobacteria bacterium]